MPQQPCRAEIRRAITTLDGRFGPAGGPQTLRQLRARLEAWFTQRGWIGSREEHVPPGILWP
jgi:hypothetical protein